MTKNDYLRLLVEEMHSAAVATIDKDGHPQLRIIDMMLWDEQGVYFLTARGKAFYEQLAGAGLYRAHRCPRQTLRFHARQDSKRQQAGV